MPKALLACVFCAALATAAAHAMTDPSGGSVEPAPSASEPVAAFFLRASVVPRPEDIAPLKQGLALMIGSSQGGMTIVEYRVADGKIVYEVTSGSISDKDRKAIEKAVAKMQKQL